MAENTNRLWRTFGTEAKRDNLILELSWLQDRRAVSMILERSLDP